MPRLAIAQLRPTKGDYNANLQKIGGVLAQIAKLDPPVDLVIFPETATSGYFVEGGVRDVAVTAGTLFRDLTVEHEAAGAPPVDVAVGFYEVFQNHFYNSCLYASLGNASSGNASPGVKHVHRKVFLPTYGVFDEERFVDRGREIRAFDTRWGRAAILVCEDAWHSLSGTIAALQGAQLVIVPSASPARGTGERERGNGRHRACSSIPLLTASTFPASRFPLPAFTWWGRGWRKAIRWPSIPISLAGGWSRFSRTKSSGAAGSSRGSWGSRAAWTRRSRRSSPSRRSARRM